MISSNRSVDEPEMVAPVAFAVSALGGALGEDTTAGFILMACGAVVLGVCVWLMIYRT